MHKTITGLLVDIALKNKKLNSTAEPVTNYLKPLKGTSWDSVSVENALAKSSGFSAKQRLIIGVSDLGVQITPTAITQFLNITY